MTQKTRVDRLEDVASRTGTHRVFVLYVDEDGTVTDRDGGTWDSEDAWENDVRPSGLDYVITYVHDWRDEKGGHGGTETEN